ncbi:hypothetical protein Glove_219g133 [Diversispora epigaea]|uniref:Protein kinase domain-containing protein n=1 Tax=Diversispora epigaea TaxID=1348612 RepID=A0A397IIZ2_9GLOM|nr:hypothetical protein Glove_219g133 [Diversispora epigaea]
MSQGETNEKETWSDNLIIEDKIQKENIPFYQYSEFNNIKFITANIYKATFKITQKTVALKNVCLNDNDKFILDNLLNEIKRHRKLEIHDSILKFYGITKQENTNNYMIVLEYVNEGSLRQYLKTNFQKMDWNAKLNLAKQIANVLMFLHSNDIIYRKFNSENILVNNGIIKFNVFGITKIIPDSLSFLTNILGPIQYMDPQYLELFSTIDKNKSSDIFGLGIVLWEISSGNPPFEMESSSNVNLLNNIAKGKREMAIPGTPHKYKEIYTDCWKHNGNSRPDIFQVVKNLAETHQSQPYNATDFEPENLNMKNEESEIKINPPFVEFTTEAKPDPPFVDVTAEVKPDSSFVDVTTEVRPDPSSVDVTTEIRPDPPFVEVNEHKKNFAEIIYLYEMILHLSCYFLFISSFWILCLELSSGIHAFCNVHGLNILFMVKSRGRETPIQETPLDYVNTYSYAWDHNPIQRPTIEYIDISHENIEKFEKDSVSSCSSSLEKTGINYTYDQATFIRKPEYVEDINNSYNRTSSPTIEDTREAFTSNFFDNEWIINNEITKYDYDDFKNITNIGRGAYGSVCSATLKVALKSVYSVKLFVNELKQHSKVCSHENIIGFYGVSKKDLNSDEYILVLEYANGGTLRDYLKSNFKNLEWSDKLNLAQQIAKGIKHLHSCDVIHRDLHSENIFVHNSIIKIGDFGLAKLISDPSIDLLKGAGSIAYSDPMFLSKGDEFERNKASDIYSYGILSWEISSGEIPYKQYKEELLKMNHIINGNREIPVEGTPQDYINIYQDCWKQDPNERPNINLVDRNISLVKLK